jgi:hypothetical protein
MENLQGNPNGKYGNVGRGYREFLEMALEGRPGRMCGGPYGTTHDNLLEITHALFKTCLLKLL